MPGISNSHGRVLGDAAAVCLENRHHSPGKVLKVHKGVSKGMCSLLREPCTDQQKRCYNDLPEATAWGASAIGIELARDLTGMVVVRRSRKGTGFDYWLGLQHDESREPRARLEVSGMLHGTQ